MSAVSPPSFDRVLSPDEAINYWDSRHRARGELLSGGHLGFDHATNEIFYALRVGRLIDAIGDVSATDAPLRVLDAGCGKGYFSRAMASFGHLVDGIDSSGYAVDLCRTQAGELDSYHVSTLSDWRPAYLYDVVFSVDVLFHIMDDSLWSTSVRNLSSLIRWGGKILLSDHDEDEDHIWGEYQKTRSGLRYREILEPAGFRWQQYVPNGFRDSNVGLHVYTRRA